MAIRYYCDGCGKEIKRDYVGQRFHPALSFGGANWVADILTSKNGTSSAGDLCLECVLKIVNEGKE